MKTATHSMSRPFHWGRILPELGMTLAHAIHIAALYYDVEALEPGDGPVALLKSGAKLYWSDSRGEAIISGYAQDGSDVDCYLG